MVVKALPWPAGSLIRTRSRTRYTPAIFCSASSWLTSCQIPAIANFYMTVYGDEEEANVTVVPMQSKGKQDVGKPGGWRVTQVCNPISSRS